jgi:phospholipid/cholesterol/gamma-HCH transport system ATP-binding protein
MISNDKIKPIIEVKNLNTCFDGVWVHKNLNLKLYPNRIITIIGASGCGKTTLVREIMGLEQPTSGEIYIANEKISNFNIEDPEAKIRLSKVGMMFQHGALFSSLSVIENVMFPITEYTNFSKQTIYEIAQLKLKLTGLPENAYNRYPQELSGGMLKRVALARTLALDPQVIFLDEPTSGLDANSANDLDELIQELQKQLSLTVVMITHDLSSIWDISDELVYLGEQRVLLHDTVYNAANNTKIKELHEYFNGKRGNITKQFHISQKTRGTNHD